MRTFDPALVRVAVVLARRFGAGRDDAEDVAQEALLKLLTHEDSIEDPMAWLFVVVRRLSRRVSSCQERQLPRLSSFDPWRGVELDIDTRRLLERCTLRGRRCIQLSLAGFSEREIAARVGCSVKAVEKALYLARHHVRARLTATKERF